MDKIFDFDQVNLLPKKCIVSSRSECDTSFELGGHKFTVPIVPANMLTVINEDLCIELAKKSFFYVMHRFNVDSAAFIKRCNEEKVISSIALGIKKENFDLVKKLAKEKLIPDFITIDVAHGHSETVRKLIKTIKETMGDTPFLIVGNVATRDAVKDLEIWGADCIKVGVGPGKVCTTRFKTGFGTGGFQLSAIKWLAETAKVPLICDGGLRHHGDIAKAIRFGATLCMVGSILSGHDESPGELIEQHGKKYKAYFGSASEHTKGYNKRIEGKKILVEYKGSLWDTLDRIIEDLQSSISYAGGKDLSALKEVDYVVYK